MLVHKEKLGRANQSFQQVRYQSKTKQPKKPVNGAICNEKNRTFTEQSSPVHKPIDEKGNSDSDILGQNPKVAS